MIRKLRIKFIAVTMASIGCLFLLILLVINLFMNLSSRQQGYRTLEDFAQQISAPAPEFDKTMGSPDTLSPDADGTPELSQPPAHPILHQSRVLRTRSVFSASYATATAIFRNLTIITIPI